MLNCFNYQTYLHCYFHQCHPNSGWEIRTFQRLHPWWTEIIKKDRFRQTVFLYLNLSLTSNLWEVKLWCYGNYNVWSWYTFFNVIYWFYFCEKWVKGSFIIAIIVIKSNTISMNENVLAFFQPLPPFDE